MQGAHMLLDEDEDKRAPIIRWTDEERLFCMASTPGNRLITGGAPGGEIALWDARTGTKEYTLLGHNDSVLALCVVLSHNALYSAGADSTVRSWNLDTMQSTMVFEGHKGFVVGLFAEGEVDPTTGLFSGSDDRTIKQWNVNSGACVHTFRGHKGPVNAIVGNGQYLFSGSSDGLLKVWEIGSRRCVRTVEAHKDSVWALCLLSDGRLISGSTDATIKVWEDLVHSANVVTELNGHRGKVRRLLVQGPILFSAGADSYINVWNLNSANLVETLKVHEKQVSGLTLENNQLCSCGFDRLIARWDVTDLLPVKQPIKPFQPLSAVRAKELDAARQKVQEVNYLRNKRKIREKTPEEIVAMYKELPVNFVCNALEYKVQSSALSLEVLAYIPFLICFVFVFMLTRPIEETFYMVNGVSSTLTAQTLPSFKLPRQFETVSNTYWFYQWFDLVTREVWATPPATQFDRPTFQGQNILIGSLRLRQKRVTSYSCTFSLDMIGNTSAMLAASSSWADPSKNYTAPTRMPCFGDLTSDTEQRFPFVCPDTAKGCSNSNTSLQKLGLGPEGFRWTDDDASMTGQLNSYDGGAYILDFPFNESYDSIRERRLAMIDLGFVDDVATRFLDMTFYMYNPAIDIFLSVRYAFEIPTGGTWTATRREVGFSIFSLTNVGALVFEFFFFSFILVFAVLFLMEFRAEWRKSRVLGFLLNWWNLMEITNLTIFIVMYSYRWRWMRLASHVDKPALLDSTTFPEILQASQKNFQYQVWFNAVNTILTFLKLLKYVRLNDRLNVLTRTLAACQQSLIGVLALFVYVVLGYAVCGNSLYGSGVFGFRTLDASYITLLRTLIGDGDYDSMSEESREVTVIFFWAFHILCLFILLNFLVAVISDGFADVSETKSVIPLDQAIVKVFQDAKYECLPKTLRLKLLLLRHRRTQTGVIKETLEQLLEKRRNMVDEAAAQRGDYDELEDTFIHRDDLVSMIPNESRSLLSEEFVEEVWKDMAWEYHYQQLGKKGQDEHEKEMLIHEEVRQALRPLSAAFPVIEAISQRLELQEAKLRPFANSVGVSF